MFLNYESKAILFIKLFSINRFYDIVNFKEKSKTNFYWKKSLMFLDYKRKIMQVDAKQKITCFFKYIFYKNRIKRRIEKKYCAKIENAYLLHKVNKKFPDS